MATLAISDRRADPRRDKEENVPSTPEAFTLGRRVRLVKMLPGYTVPATSGTIVQADANAGHVFVRFDEPATARLKNGQAIGIRVFAVSVADLVLLDESATPAL